MTFNKKQIKEIITQEIKWHKDNSRYEFDKNDMPEDWVKGFIEGLKHLNKLFNKLK